MSAGICGKRVGLEEIFGSTSSGPVKKLRCCGSADFGFGSEDKLSVLTRMFPHMDREVIETVLRIHEHNIDDAIKSLHDLCLSDDPARNEPVILQTNVTASDGSADVETFEQKIEGTHNSGLIPGTSWVDIFLQEMATASNMEDARSRTVKILDAFGKSIFDQSNASKEQEVASLKEQLEGLMRDNQILKKAFALQHQKNLENKEKLTEVQQLKHMLGRYQEQIRTLEMSNYSLQVHLQRANEASSIPGRFHPDVF